MRPNVLFILSDDQGPWALGCAGNDEIHTPHLDRLAASGVRLSRFFAASPVCSPARASLFTGEIPSQHGVHDWLSAAHTGPEGIDFLAGRRLFTDDLHSAGYRLGLVGKWHLGANDRPRPGFVHWYAHESGGGPYYGATIHRSFAPEPEQVSGPEPVSGPVRVEGYLTDALTAQAQGFLTREASREEPFYLSLHYTAPHKPWKGQHPAAYEALYASCAFATCPQEPAHPWQPVDASGTPVGGEPDVRAALIGYFAAVTAMDAGIGAVLATLSELGLTESTLVIFTSDNGFNCGHHGVWGKGNGTFPQNMYDSSVMVPAILSHPGRLPAARVSDTLLSAYDLRPTLLDYLAVPGPTRGPGRSFTPVLYGKAAPPATPSQPGQVALSTSTASPGTASSPNATVAPSTGDAPREVVVFDEYGPVRMIRTDDWKYVHRYPYGPHELYHLAADPGERHNLAEEGRPELADLRERLDRWFATHVDPAVDGSRLPVSGSGQHSPASLGAFEPPPRPPGP